MKKLTVSVGERFGKLTVTQSIAGVDERHYSLAKCLCDCGKEVLRRISWLHCGYQKSCGCESITVKAREKYKDCVGKTYGRLTVKKIYPGGDEKHIECDAECECGQSVRAALGRIYSGRLKSCGCLRREVAFLQGKENAGRKITHGLYGTAIHQTWKSMVERCYTPSHSSWKYYGERGIRVCLFLKKNPENLLSEVGLKPSHEMSIDRKNNDGHYSCGHCSECMSNGWTMNIRWATPKEQAENRRSINAP